MECPALGKFVTVALLFLALAISRPASGAGRSLLLQICRTAPPPHVSRVGERPRFYGASRIGARDSGWRGDHKGGKIRAMSTLPHQFDRREKVLLVEPLAKLQ